MLGWERLAAVRPSRLKRALTSEPSRSERRILTATGRSSTSSRPKNTVDIPPEPISRTSTNLPPRRFTAVTPPRLDDLPAHGAREGLEDVLEAKQRPHRQRLLAIAQRLAGVVVALDHQPVGLGGYGRLGEGHDQVAAACGVGGVNDHGQVGQP